MTAAEHKRLRATTETQRKQQNSTATATPQKRNGNRTETLEGGFISPQKRVEFYAQKRGSETASS